MHCPWCFQHLRPHIQNCLLSLGGEGPQEYLHQGKCIPPMWGQPDRFLGNVSGCVQAEVRGARHRLKRHLQKPNDAPQLHGPDLSKNAGNAENILELHEGPLARRMVGVHVQVHHPTVPALRARALAQQPVHDVEAGARAGDLGDMAEDGHNLGIVPIVQYQLQDEDIACGELSGQGRQEAAAQGRGSAAQALRRQVGGAAVHDRELVHHEPMRRGISMQDPR
mmetsp:Transcript_38062/g.121236  ORF Transcript_38062/g.121236 Transcript_38062/m.121236 type:complete len:223 (+) Transcript_38062:57-725(+)